MSNDTVLPKAASASLSMDDVAPVTPIVPSPFMSMAMGEWLLRSVAQSSAHTMRPSDNS